MLIALVIFLCCLSDLANGGPQNETLAKFAGKCSELGEQVKHKKNGECQNWYINVIYAFDHYTTDAQNTDVESFLSDVISDCSAESYLQVYYPGLPTYEDFPKCKVDDCRFLATNLPWKSGNGGYGEIELGRDAVVFMDLFKAVFNFVDRNPLPDGAGGVIYFITTVPCSYVNATLHSVIENQVSLVNQSRSRGYLLEIIIEEENYTNCQTRQLFDFCSERAQLLLANELKTQSGRMKTCPARPTRTYSSWMGAIIAVCILGLILVIVILVYRFRKTIRMLRTIIFINSNLKSPSEGKSTVQNIMQGQGIKAVGNNYTNLVAELHDEYEIRCNELIVHEDIIIGKGAFALVYRGIITRNALERLTQNKVIMSTAARYANSDAGLEVAVKELRPHADSSSRADFQNEIEFMKRLKHHVHVLGFLAYVSRKESPKIVTEYCASGNLLGFLHAYRVIVNTADCNETEIQLKQLHSFAWQISDGMNYLSSLGIVHRDLAARNILLTDELTAKISDFGLCRRLDEALYTAKGGKLPIKWMAIESLRKYEFNIMTDVWSFGILLFELFSLGDAPYHSLQPDEVLDYLEAGNRMKAPKDCPCEVYDIMASCWMAEPSERPTFQKIGDMFSGLLNTSDENYGYLSIGERY